TETNLRPGAELSYRSLYAMPDEFRTRLGQLVADCDQITLLGLSGRFPLEHLPFFKEQVKVAVGLHGLRVRVLIGHPQGKSLTRAVEEGVLAEEYPDRVKLAVDEWSEVLQDTAGDSIRLFRQYPSAMIYQFGDHGILTMIHLHNTSGYDCPVVWHSRSSPAWDAYVAYLDRVWDVAEPMPSG
ncbi:MAG: hypothetical protein GY926_23210, partial [bacterium]|nr:hypothetical protein [bacterium]